MYGRLENNYVSVVPVQFDLTNYTLKVQKLKNRGNFCPEKR